MRIARPVVISLVVLIAALTLCSCAQPVLESAGYTWNLQHEVEDFDFWSVSALGAEDAWAVGFDRDYRGTAYSYDGRNWKKSGSFEGKINTVFALDREHVWAAGDGIYFFDGDSWEKQYEPEEAINDVSAIDTTDVWAVGDQGGIYFFNGSSWTEQHRARGGMFSVSAIDKDNVWAVGQGEDVLFFDGSNWDRRLGLSRTTLFSVLGVKDYQVWAVGTHKWNYPVFEYSGGYPHHGYIAFFDGSTWENAYRAEESLFDVAAVDRDHVWASGERHIYFHDGSSWERQFSYERGVYHVDAPDPGNVWAVGGTRIYHGYK